MLKLPKEVEERLNDKAWMEFKSGELIEIYLKETTTVLERYIPCEYSSAFDDKESTILYFDEHIPEEPNGERQLFDKEEGFDINEVTIFHQLSTKTLMGVEALNFINDCFSTNFTLQEIKTMIERC